MQNNYRITLGVIMAIFVIIIMIVFFFIWKDSEITNKWITGGLLIANLSVAFLIYLQMRQSNDQFLDLNRPWIHFDLEHSNEITYPFDKPRSTTVSPLFLVNSGKLAALDVEITFLESESNIHKDLLQYIPQYIQFNSIPPNFKHTLFSDVSFAITATQYLAYSITYKFNGESNKNNAYIIHHDHQLPRCTDKRPGEITNNSC